MLGLSAVEFRTLKRLSTPILIQDYLNRVPMNWDDSGDCLSPRRLMREQRAHCIEGALFAAAALWVHGERPLIMDLAATPEDDDHVLALYKRNGHWGSISKTNHATIRFRDPVYKTLRELALSYFHEWFMNKNAKKTLRNYSAPLNMKEFGAEWVTSEKGLFWVEPALNALPHYPLVPRGNEKYLRPADKMELKAGKLVEYRKKPVHRRHT